MSPRHYAAFSPPGYLRLHLPLLAARPPRLHHGRLPAASRSSPILALLLAGVLLGCANPGPPRPPALHLPGLAQGLAAQRTGDQVSLSWITPENSTEGDAIRTPITAVLCREEPSSNPGPHPCTPLQHLVIPPGPSRMTDVLPPSLSAGQPTLLSYKVELFNSHGRSAGASTSAYTAAGTSPVPIGPLSLTPRRAGVLITWPANPDGSASPLAIVELKRLTDPGSLPPTPKPAQGSPPGKNKAIPPSATAGEVILRADPADSASTLANGLLDPGVHDRETYTYTAQRVLALTLAGHPLQLRGLPSPPARFTFRNLFPPSAPTGLVSIPTAGPTRSIDLSWDPGEDPAPLTYNLFRATNPSAAFTRLNPQPLPSPAYRDASVKPGHTYIYRVTAIDPLGNESKPSPEVSQTLAN